LKIRNKYLLLDCLFLGYLGGLFEAMRSNLDH
jgi:hypothetical protein